MFLNKNINDTEKGFTLVELAVSLAVIGVLAAGAVTSIVASLPQMRLKKAVREFLTAMQQTKLDAIKHNGTWQISFNPTNYQIISSGDDRVIGNADDVIVRTVNLLDYGSGVAYGAGNATQDWNGNALPAIPPAAALSFDNRGLTNILSVYFTNQNNTTSYSITTNLAGGKKLRFYNGATPFNVANWSED